MSKYIDADELKRSYAPLEGCLDVRTLDGAKKIFDAFVDGMPAADVQEVQHGRWENINRNKYNDDEATCSLCGKTFSSSYSDPCWWDYCPHCGAIMDKEENE